MLKTSFIRINGFLSNVFPVTKVFFLIFWRPASWASYANQLSVIFWKFKGSGAEFPKRVSRKEEKFASDFMKRLVFDQETMQLLQLNFGKEKFKRNN